MSARSSVQMVSAEGTQFSVATGAVCIDFVYTGGAGERAKWETLREPADLVDWACNAGLIDSGIAADVEFDDLDIAFQLREVLWDSANRLVDGGRPSAAAVALINRVARNPDIAPQLSSAASGGLSRSALGPVTGGEVLSTLARDAILLFGGPSAERVKRCAAQDCALLFVDTSRPGLRRWCAMSRCGNRDKARTRRRLERDHAGVPRRTQSTNFRRGTPVGKTKDAGGEIGVSKTLPYSVDAVWELLVGKPFIWLGEGAVLPTEKGDQWNADDGTTGELRSRRENDRIRLTWRLTGWGQESTVQVALSKCASGTVVRFHQERLVDAAHREAQREQWQEVMARVEAALVLVG